MQIVNRRRDQWPTICSPQAYKIKMMLGIGLHFLMVNISSDESNYDFPPDLKSKGANFSGIKCLEVHMIYAYLSQALRKEWKGISTLANMINRRGNFAS